jgi:hypothetical protein
VDFYEDLGVDMFKDAISVPGVTLKYLFKTLPKDVSFSLCSKREQDLHNTIRENIVGGPSIIFHRYHEKDQTFVRGNSDKAVQGIKDYDANALYLWALMQKMPTDFPIIRKKEDGFKPRKTNYYGEQSRQWLGWVSHNIKVQLKTQFNGGEMSLGRRHIRVDGWDMESRTVYQFHGCVFHGHPDCPLTRGREVNPVNNKPLTELFDKTCEITAYLTEKVKVKVVEMWECQWQHLKNTEPAIKSFLLTERPKKTTRLKPSYGKKWPLTDKQILDAVIDETCFGLIECDISVPESLRDHFSEMTPIFKNVDVTRDDIGDFMREHAFKNKLLTGSRRTLIGSYIGEKILLATPLLKWYLTHGLQVTNIYQVIEYQPVTCFRKFGDTVSEARRQGDKNDVFAITSETMKLLGNAAYGKTLTNKSKHADMSYCRGAETTLFINTPLFKKMTQLGDDDLFEVESLKKKTLWDLPLQIGFFVYQYAKLRMLEFYYDFIDRYVARTDFQLCEMDTDSLYLALSTHNLADAVRPQLRHEFYKVYDRWFPSETCPTHRAEFISSQGKTRFDCQNCRDRKLYEKRTPGLFKLEYEGAGMVSLCSKTYHCFGEYDKTSTKGLTKQHNTLDKNIFMDVLTTQQAQGGKNVGFKTQGAAVYTYTQHRNSLSYFYIKRQVHPDNVTTSPLTI